MPDAIDRLDDALDDAWEALRGNPVIDRIFYTASEAADFSVLWHTLGVAQAIAKNDPKIAIALSAAAWSSPAASRLAGVCVHDAASPGITTFCAHEGSNSRLAD